MGAVTVRAQRGPGITLSQFRVVDTVESLCVVIEMAPPAKFVLGDAVTPGGGDFSRRMWITGNRTMAIGTQEFISMY